VCGSVKKWKTHRVDHVLAKANAYARFESLAGEGIEEVSHEKAASGVVPEGSRKLVRVFAPECDESKSPRFRRRSPPSGAGQDGISEAPRLTVEFENQLSAVALPLLITDGAV
jgi:hypothetical protein